MCKEKPSSSSDRESVQSTDSTESKVHKNSAVANVTNFVHVNTFYWTFTCFCYFFFFAFVDANTKYHFTTVDRPESFD